MNSVSVVSDRIKAAIGRLCDCGVVWQRRKEPAGSERKRMIGEMKRVFVFITSIAVMTAVGGWGVEAAAIPFAVEFNETNGGLDSLTLSSDTNRLNWIEGTGTWGTIRAYSPKINWSTGTDEFFNPPLLKFVGGAVTNGAGVFRYEDGAGLRATVTRRMDGNVLEESYEFENMAYAPRYFLKGQLGILATFNDSYAAANVCNYQRCHAHIHAFGTKAYVHAMRMSPGVPELVLKMTEGALDGYSVRRIKSEISNDRGDFVLHPAPFVLKRGEKKTFAWEISFVEEGTFTPPVRVKYETCFPGEEFEITDASGTRKIKAERPGELTVDGARLNVAPCGRDVLIERCIRHIVRKQQCLDEASPLYGAFLLYDDRTHSQYFDDRFGDHNACRERTGMGMLIARWLQTHHDREIEEAFARYEKFVFREFVDRETGMSYNTIGKDPGVKRLYNAPNSAMLLMELYRLRKDVAYLETTVKVLLEYYEAGGWKFYANGAMATALAIDAGRKEGLDVAELSRQYRRQVDRILENGIDYPAHEVKFEQTIVTPAVALLAHYWLYVEKDPKVLEGVRRQLEMLVRFDGDQPDWRCGGVPIRHWDGYWFGGKRLYGDTLHYHAGLSANCYMLAYRLFGEEGWRERARRCFRNSLGLFREDGFGTAAYYLPVMVTLIDKENKDLSYAMPAEGPDPWDNDQYTVLYMMLQTEQNENY